ncbi:MAG: hypothetical protein IJC16_01275 [Rikenellaceae bacterium]|nr:hypothetical protein [Rikenellaceae bacterium]
MLATAHHYLKQEFPLCYSGRAAGAPHSQAGQGAWYALIDMIAQHLPSEVAAAERMPCYRFMQLAHNRLAAVRRLR